MARGRYPDRRTIVGGHPPLEDAIWACLEKVAGHLGMIMSKVKRIGDEVCEVKEDRRMRKRLQVGVQMEAREVMEVGVGEEEEEKGKETEDREDGDKDGEDGDKDGEGDKDMEEYGAVNSCFFFLLFLLSLLIN